jgi:hypothetical protein
MLFEKRRSRSSFEKPSRGKFTPRGEAASLVTTEKTKEKKKVYEKIS